VATTKRFLDAFPESVHSADAIDVIFYYQGTEMDDAMGAAKYAESVRDRISDPEIAREVDRQLIGIYGEVGMVTEMIVLADRLAAAGALDFSDHWKLIEGAVIAEDWKLTRSYCEKARKLANTDAYRADFSDKTFSEEELVKAVGEREGKLLVKDGWARANLGQTDEALADFANADRLIPRYYFDIPEYDLNVYWARTLMMKGDYEAAIERLATDGLVMRNEDALAGLKQAYVGINGDGSGFDAYAADLHKKIATTIDDFEMPDYEGKRHRFSEIRSDVTLLTLWFPT
jgi:tetratricopeptide (TPR) repeat protein